MMGLTKDQKFELLASLIAKNGSVAPYTLEHIILTDICTCGVKVERTFVYDFCPIAGDPDFLHDNEPDYDMSNFDASVSRYVKR